MNNRACMNPNMGPMPPTNMMMFPNYMNDNNMENRVSTLEKKVDLLEKKVTRLENMNNQNIIPQYQTTQNGQNLNNEMYMM